jgi:hypothetical protein
MAKHPWFKVFAADTLTDARLQDSPLATQAIVFRMWCVCHLEGCCPADPEEIAIRTRVRLSDVSLNESFIKSFFELRNGKLYSARMEAEKRRSDTNRRNKLSGLNKEDKGSVERLVEQTDERLVERRSDSDSIGSKNKFLEEKAEEIYKHYPRKVGRPAAIKAIISAIAKVKGDAGFLVQRTKAFANSPAGNAGEFTPHPATWFNQERYNDDPIQWERTDKRQPISSSSRPDDSWMVYDPNRPSVYGGGQ